MLDTFEDFLSLRFSEGIAAVINLLKTLEQDVIVGAEQVIVDALQLVANNLKQAFDSLDSPLDIPFISQLYQWITGEPLTVLDWCASSSASPSTSCTSS